MFFLWRSTCHTAAETITSDLLFLQLLLRIAGCMRDQVKAPSQRLSVTATSPYHIDLSDGSSSSIIISTCLCYCNFSEQRPFQSKFFTAKYPQPPPYNNFSMTDSRQQPRNSELPTATSRDDFPTGIPTELPTTSLSQRICAAPHRSQIKKIIWVGRGNITKENLFVCRPVLHYLFSPGLSTIQATIYLLSSKIQIMHSVWTADLIRYGRPPI